MKRLATLLSALVLLASGCCKSDKGWESGYVPPPDLRAIHFAHEVKRCSKTPGLCREDLVYAQLAVDAGDPNDPPLPPQNIYYP